MNVQPVSNAMRTPSWKRVIDMCCCLVVSPLLALLTHVMTILATLVSPGLVLFRQERVGYQGRRFMCYKFRTMVVGADTRLHQQYFANLIGTKAPMGKIESRGDSRLIMGGRFFARLRLGRTAADYQRVPWGHEHCRSSSVYSL